MHTRSLAVLLAVFAIPASTLLAQAPQQAPQQAAQQAPQPEGRVVHEKVNPYTFQPKDVSVAAGPNVNLRETFEALGPEAIEWYQHVQTLSNPWFEGRCPGSEGHERAVEYIAWWMEKLGLAPAFGDSAAGSSSYRQPFTLTGAEPIVKAGALDVQGKALARDKDFIVAAASAGGSVTAPIAFAGYAIKEGKDGYTSFDGDDDLRGKIAVLFRFAPLGPDGNERWAGQEGAPRIRMADKLREVAERGAAGILVVNAPDAKSADRPLEDLRTSRWGGSRGIPVMQITVEAADALMRAADPQGRDLRTLRSLADEGTLKDFAGKPDVKVTMTAEIGESTVPAANVGGILQGKGSLKDEWIIIGGHLDHVGYGRFGTDPANRGQLHPGADDNASGTAGVLVSARRLGELYAAAPSDANLRSVLFLCFSGEESGLDGSAYWTKNPSIPPKSVTAMLNMDMIGRLRNDELSIGGTGTAKGFDAKLEPHIKSSGLFVHADPSGSGPSDHASFYRVGVPVLFFFTGTHDNYHRPSDKGYTVNPAGATKIVRLVGDIAADLADDPQRLEFQSSEGTPGQDRGYASVRLGVMPSMNDADAGGVLVESVSAGTSAADAGIQKGDILFSWNGKELGGPGDLMSRLRDHRPGDKVRIALRRDGKDLDVTVTLKASQPRE
ncbi:MAG: M28 family peptidase [Phycisphaerae bacterium]|nr:M28 family peptidase [Phycisphaerae bacterium]